MESVEVWKCFYYWRICIVLFHGLFYFTDCFIYYLATSIFKSCNNWL